MPVHARKEQLSTAWSAFVDKGIINKELVRPEIADSWHRSRASAIDPVVEIFSVMVSPEEYEQRRHAKRALLEIALPIMENLHSFVKGSSFAVSLSDQDGVVLDFLADWVEEGTGKGHNLNEGKAGTNSVGLALKLGRPVQVFATEHYMKIFHPFSVSSAPIHDNSGTIIGVLSMAGDCDKVHSHTLGMVVASVNAIERELKINIANDYQNAIVDSMSEGLIAVNEMACITKINAAAAALLNVDSETIMHSSINDVLGDQNPVFRSLQTGSLVSDKEFHAVKGNQKTHCTISCRPIHNPEQKIVGVVAIIREIRAVKKLVQNMVGARARFSFEDLIGRNPSYLKTVQLARRAAKSSSNVLLLGESGTGKEVFAQAIHNASASGKGPFIAINCGAIPRELIGSEMFGYSDGAFTGAKRGGNPGKFELAEGGTIFLDEIGEMPLELQTHLLRVLQERVVTRIGGDQVIPVDVRVIAASNKDLHKEVEKGRFRSDLYYRLNVLKINMVSLRKRSDDIPLLTHFFMEQISRRLGQETKVLYPETLEILLRYHWPGNIRELENVIESAIHLAVGEVLTVECLPEEIISSAHTKYTHYMELSEDRPGDEVIIRKNGKAVVMETVKRHHGNLTHAAKELGIARSTLYSKLKKYGIQVK